MYTSFYLIKSADQELLPTLITVFIYFCSPLVVSKDFKVRILGSWGIFHGVNRFRVQIHFGPGFLSSVCLSVLLLSLPILPFCWLYVIPLYTEAFSYKSKDAFRKITLLRTEFFSLCVPGVIYWKQNCKVGCFPSTALRRTTGTMCR